MDKTTMKKDLDINMEKILVLSCHPDDMELGCGATVNRLVQRKYGVYSVVFSVWNPELSGGKLLKEWHQSMSILGIIEANRYTFNYPTRKFHACRQEILDDLVELKRTLNPDYVFTPSIKNIHQDHSVLGSEALRIFRDINLWNYELQWSEIDFRPQFYVPVSSENLKFKIKALKQYESRYELKRPYLSEKFIRELASFRGIQIGVELAEAFMIQRGIKEF